MSHPQGLLLSSGPPLNFELPVWVFLVLRLGSVALVAVATYFVVRCQ